jgi:PAT family beta-lactamase induction signal transducer AmpG
MGLGTAAFVAYTATTTNPAYAGTQFALFSGLAAIPRTLANAMCGYLIEGGDIALFGSQLWHIEGLGWERFFWFCFFATAPGMLLLPKVAPWAGTQFDSSSTQTALAGQVVSGDCRRNGGC